MSDSYVKYCNLHTGKDRSFNRTANTKRLLSQMKTHIDSIRDALEKGEDPRLIPCPAVVRASAADDGLPGFPAGHDG